MKKNILLIGGSTGIGRKLAEKLAEKHNVFIASRNAADLGESGIKHLKFDVLKDDISELELPDKIGGLAYFPGSINLKPFKMLSPQAFEEDMNLNFFGMIRVIQALLPKLKAAENSSLVFFSTVAVKLGMPFHTSVAAAKGAVEGFAKSLAAEYAPSLRVNVIAPSLTDTPMAEKLLSSEEKREKMGKRHPLKRVGETNEIAQMAAFLLEDDSSWITGQIFGVDGGLSTLNLS